MGLYLSPADKGFRMELGRYGEVTVSLLGRYQIANATLAVQSAGNIHARLPGMAHGSPEYVEAIRTGLADVMWPGRCQKLQDKPTVFIDGAINAESAESFVESVRDHLRPPVVAVVCVPEDKDYLGVFKVMGAVSQTMIITETARNPSLHFLDSQSALNAARQFNANVSYAPNVQTAVDSALKQAGTDGTVLLAGTQSLLADAMQIWRYTYEVI
jgi:dihydrofolate synthase/folylpolyglutamate synthase